MAIFSADTTARRAAIAKYADKAIKAPWVRSEVSTLGGVERASVMVKVSLDKKSDWYNGILQNSRYFMVRVDRNGEIEMFAGSYRLAKKMRRTTAKSLPDAMAKINRYIQSVK